MGELFGGIKSVNQLKGKVNLGGRLEATMRLIKEELKKTWISGQRSQRNKQHRKGGRSLYD